MKQTFSNVKGGKTIEIIYSRDHLELGHVQAKSLRNGRVQWKCNICGKKFTSSALYGLQDNARMRAWGCAESHFDDTQKYYEG